MRIVRTTVTGPAGEEGGTAAAGAIGTVRDIHPDTLTYWLARGWKVDANDDGVADDVASSGAYESRLTVGTRMRRAAAAAEKRNSIDLGAMASPPTITTGTAVLDAALTKAYRTNSGQASSFRVTGGIAQQGASAFAPYRVAPVITMPSGSGGNTAGVGAKNSYGWAWEFMTDAPDVQLRSLGSSGTYMIEVDDQPVSGTALTHASAGGTVYAKLAFGSSKVRKIRVEFAFGQAFDGVYVGPTYSIWPPASDTNVMVATVGDSICASTGATYPNGGWEHVAAKLLGWTDVRQVAFGGTGFVNAGSSLNTFGSALRVADVVAHNPDAIVIQASQNDDVQTGVQAAALACFQAYRTALPSTPIIVLGVDASSSGPSAGRIATETTIKAAFDQWADSNSYWIPNTNDTTGSWEYGTGTTGATTGTGNRDRFGYDAAHPNDAGHLYIGRRFANAFRSLVLPYIK